SAQGERRDQYAEGNDTERKLREEIDEARPRGRVPEMLLEPEPGAPRSRGRGRFGERRNRLAARRSRRDASRTRPQHDRGQPSLETGEEEPGSAHEEKNDEPDPDDRGSQAHRKPGHQENEIEDTE